MSECLNADVVIVGSGVAGALCAYRLAQQGIKVIVLEAGPRLERNTIVENFKSTPSRDFLSGYPNPDWAPRPDWSNTYAPYITNSGNANNQPEYLRAIGGTTWVWSGSALRLQPEDFHLYSLYGVGVDWPLSYNTLETDYADAERELGVAGDTGDSYEQHRSTSFPMPPVPTSYAERWVTERLNDAGFTFSSRPSARNTIPYDGRGQCNGYGSCTPICPVGAQYSAMVHVQKAERLGVRFIENCRVDQLRADASGLITGLAFTRSSGTTGTACGSLYAIAANGIETPRLLLMSATEQYPNGLANSSGEVGRNYMDHPGVSIQMDLPEPVFSGRGPISNLVSMNNCSGEFRRARSAWTLGTNNSIDLHEVARQELENGTRQPSLDKAIRQRANHLFHIEAHMEQLAISSNRITLDWAHRDRAGQPKICLNYNYGTYEQAGFASIQRAFETISQALKARTSKISEPYTLNHLMGATRMGSDARSSVADPHGRTHDHLNLFLLGSSLFPSSGTANPTLTIAALALRTARAIHKQLNHNKKI